MRSRLTDAALFVLLVALGVTARLTLRDLPNFMPVAAIALFAGYYYRHAAWAIAVPLSIMLLSDLAIGMYDPRLMLTVYAMLALPVLARGVLRRTFRIDARSNREAAFALTGLVGSSLAASLAFFVVTNFMCWVNGHGYSPDVAGLTHCYVQALPFFTYTLLGDLSFSLLLFGSYGLVARMAQVSESKLAFAAK